MALLLIPVTPKVTPKAHHSSTKCLKPLKEDSVLLPSEDFASSNADGPIVLDCSKRRNPPSVA